MIDRFHITPADLLGKGGESEVYALDDLRVLRIYKPQVPVDYVERRQAFYALLHEQHLPFELPLVLERGMDGDRVYTVERRMCGHDFAGVLPALEGGDRSRALTSYLQVAEQIGAIQFPERPFSELLTAGAPLQRDSWAQFLWDRLQQTYRVSRRDVEQDVPGVDAVLAYMRAELRTLEGFQEKRLVHGDYFPGNVFVDDRLMICGVGDFGYTTVAGDSRMDLAGAVAYLEVVDGYRPDDTAFLMHLVEERHGRGMVRWLDFYRLYYSFYFSRCKADDPRTYAWCVGNLRSWLQATD
jgi:Ser/Thr protein kinase RdoA (MazF antagonist)